MSGRINPTAGALIVLAILTVCIGSTPVEQAQAQEASPGICTDDLSPCGFFLPGNWWSYGWGSKLHNWTDGNGPPRIHEDVHAMYPELAGIDVRPKGADTMLPITTTISGTVVASCGDHYYASLDTVENSMGEVSLGNYVLVKNDAGWLDLSMHLSSCSVAAGQTVIRGQQIGILGSTGNSNGPHAHKGIYNEYIGTSLDAFDMSLLGELDPGRNVPPYQVGVYEHGRRDQLGSGGMRYVALSFDLCASEGAYLDQGVVSVLHQLEVPATFFASGLFVQQHPNDMQLLSQYPFFEIEGHSWDHPNNMSVLFDAGTLDLNLQVNATNDLIEQVTGRRPLYMRLPAGNGLDYDDRGSYNGVVNEPFLQAIMAQGTSVLDWDVVSADPLASDPQKVFDNVVSQVINGSIVVMHANGKGTSTAAALQLIVPYLRDQGYALVTVEQMRNLIGLEPRMVADSVPETVGTPVIPSLDAVSDEDQALAVTQIPEGNVEWDFGGETAEQPGGMNRIWLIMILLVGIVLLVRLMVLLRRM